ncbi:RrF2 family transcriptional regulator [Reinekea sp.]|jgi:Rrf2 family nitric oxide-sensitive transcriptional repressor|uniref:RrF2 family transcriptional regulator n=1 Tax=Reinekea sp. TaxID=1970455 RepID=UPI00398A2B96
MNITRFTDYSLRVLIYLAVNENRPCTINDIALSYGISKNHLMKVVQGLSQKDFVLATRGKNGGIRLNRPPEQINIGKLVRSMEDGSKMVECFGANNQCVITPSCQMKNIFVEAQDSFYSTLEKYTLADLIGEKHRSGLVNLLSIEHAS